VLLEKYAAGEPKRRSAVGEDANDVGPALDLLVDAFERVGRRDLSPVLARERHVRDHVVFGIEEQVGPLRIPLSESVGDEPELGSGLLDAGRGEDRA